MKLVVRSYPRRAFSLIELLVVIAVVGILAMIVTSVITQARTRADQAKNTTQIRMIGLACMNFAVVNDGRIPVNTEAYAHRSAGRWVGRSSGLRELLSTRWRGGTGTMDYLASPDSFYGPFTPKLEALRRQGEFVPNGSHYDIGYIYYSLPSAARNENPTNPSLSGGLANDYLDVSNHPRTPLLCDIFTATVIEQTGFNGPAISVVHLDGSVSTIPLSRMSEVPNINTWLAVATLAGVI